MWHFNKTSTRTDFFRRMRCFQTSGCEVAEEFVEQLDLLIDTYNAAVGDLSPVQQPLSSDWISAAQLSGWAKSRGNCWESKSWSWTNAWVWSPRPRMFSKHAEVYWNCPKMPKASLSFWLGVVWGVSLSGPGLSPLNWNSLGITDFIEDGPQGRSSWEGLRGLKSWRFDQAGNQGITKFRGAFRDQVEKSEESRWKSKLSDFSKTQGFWNLLNTVETFCLIGIGYRYYIKSQKVNFPSDMVFPLIKGAHRQCGECHWECDISEVQCPSWPTLPKGICRMFQNRGPLTGTGLMWWITWSLESSSKGHSHLRICNLLTSCHFSLGIAWRSWKTWWNSSCD